MSSEIDGFRVFFSYSYMDSDLLKPLFRSACEEAGVIPIFADERIPLGESIIQALHELILTSDVVIATHTRHFSAALSIELGYVAAINKPLFYFVHRKTVFPFESARAAIYGYRTVYYETDEELFLSLSSTLSELKSRLQTPEFISKKKEEDKLIDTLRRSLQKNVLVLGKDSDDEGIRKINRISGILGSEGYQPVKLKELPEIKFLSLEDKMIRIGGLCRFVVAEDSRPSGHIDEVRLCANCQYITATVREVGTASTWMQAHYPLQYGFMSRFCYGCNTDGRDTLCDNVYETLELATRKAAEWAEERLNHQEKYFRRTIYTNWP